MVQTSRSKSIELEQFSTRTLYLLKRIAVGIVLNSGQIPLCSRVNVFRLFFNLSSSLSFQTCESLQIENDMTSRERCQALLWEYQASAAMDSDDVSQFTQNVVRLLKKL